MLSPDVFFLRYNFSMVDCKPLTAKNSSSSVEIEMRSLSSSIVTRYLGNHYISVSRDGSYPPSKYRIRLL